MTYKLDGIPSDTLSSDKEGVRRFKVESGTTAFDSGRQFRISLPLSIPNSTPLVIKFTTPIDIELRHQEIECDAETILFQAYRSTQGVESGTFDTAIPVYANNFKSTTPNYTLQSTVMTGGDFTPNIGQSAVETIRVRSAGSTAQRSTVGASATGTRGLPSGTYYLKLSNLENGTALGGFSLIFDEVG